MNCFRCGADMIWGGDNDYEDYGIDDQDGIVSNLSCPKCESFCIFYMPVEWEDQDAKEQKGFQESLQEIKTS
jgi:hypothetical protein